MDMIPCPKRCGTWFFPEPKQTTCGSETCRTAYYRKQRKRRAEQVAHGPACGRKLNKSLVNRVRLARRLKLKGVHSGVHRRKKRSLAAENRPI